MDATTTSTPLVSEPGAGRHRAGRPLSLDPAWAHSIDLDLVRRGSGQRYITEDWLPLRRLADGTLLIASTERFNDAALADALSEEFDEPVVFTRVGPWELKSIALKVFGDKVADDAANALFHRNPELSGRIVFSRSQKISGLVIGIALVVLALLWPRETAIGVLATVSLVFLAGTAFKFFVSLQGARFDVVERITDTEVAELSDDDLPVYTVLVPVFHEANIVAQLIDNLGGLDYPVHRLEVLILIEEEDLETRDRKSVV